MLIKHLSLRAWKGSLRTILPDWKGIFTFITKWRTRRICHVFVLSKNVIFDFLFLFFANFSGIFHSFKTWGIWCLSVGRRKSTLLFNKKKNGPQHQYDGVAWRAGILKYKGAKKELPRKGFLSPYKSTRLKELFLFRLIHGASSHAHAAIR